MASESYSLPFHKSLPSSTGKRQHSVARIGLKNWRKRGNVWGIGNWRIPVEPGHRSAGTTRGSARTKSCRNSQLPVTSGSWSCTRSYHQASAAFALRSAFYAEAMELCNQTGERGQRTDPACPASKASLSSLSERAPRTLLLMVDGTLSPCITCTCQQCQECSQIR